MNQTSVMRAVAASVVLGLFGTLIYFGVGPVLQWLYPLEFEELTKEVAARYDIDPLLVTAMMRVESDFNPNAVSPKGARGLMQLMPETAAWAAERLNLAEYEHDDLFDPEINISIGVWYLAALLRQFDGDLVLALAAYNGGPTNVSRWLREERWSGSIETLEDVPFRETREYIQKVTGHYHWYLRAYRSQSLFAVLSVP